MFKFKNTDIVYPLFGGEVDKEKKFFEPANLVGTCFYIGNRTFITAGHVLNQLSSYKNKVIGLYGKDIKETIKYADIARQEIYDDFDIGVFQIEQSFKLKGVKFSVDTNYALDDVITLGFPFGMRKEINGVYLRSFKGYIVSAYKYEFKSLSANCFELSMHCPRGISGAPLIYYNSAGAFHIIGVIIGNHSSEIEIYENKEIIKSENKEIHEIKLETTKFGIAVNINDVLDKSPAFLGISIKTLLESNGLLEK